MEVGPERVEEARATMLELFPEGFEEVDRPEGIELAAYTDAAGEERVCFDCIRRMRQDPALRAWWVRQSRKETTA